MKEEIWEDAFGFEGLYSVSNLGKVKSLPRKIKMPRGGYYVSKERILKPSKMPNGYLVVNLYEKGSLKRFYVHRLVAYAFLGENKNMTINHKDEDKTNNNIDNLEYLTRGDNIRYSAERHKGERKGKSYNSIPVNQYTTDGRFVARYESANLAAYSVGLKRDLTILMCCRRERNVVAGYLWRFDGDTDMTYRPIMRTRKVVQLDLKGNFISKFDTIKDAAFATGSNCGHISSCCSGRAKTANGFKWVYEKDYKGF